MSTKAKEKKKRSRVPKAVTINLSRTKYEIVEECVEEMEWRITDSSTKNLIFWCDCYGTMDFASRLNRWQFYNHFPGMGVIAHKVELAKTYEYVRKHLPRIYNFHPITYVLPAQHLDLRNAMNSSPEMTVIVKPDRGSQGRGISIIQDSSLIDTMSETSVAQEYIKPFLLDDLKFDLRIYVFVTSVDPLRIYIHEEGMARFCTEKYKPPDSSNLEDSFAHLTNFSLNKQNPSFTVDEDGGHKRYLTRVMKEMESEGVNIQKLQREIDDIIRFTLLAAQPQLSSSYYVALNVNDGKSRCFEILGFDILIDENHKPWLLEVNCMPSLQTESDLDHDLKKQVIMGALKILDIAPTFKKDCMEWFKQMSTQKSGTNIILPLFDPSRESEIAKTTKWRQLWPLGEADPKYDTVIEFMSSKNVTRATQMRRGGITTSGNQPAQKQLAQKIKNKQQCRSATNVITDVFLPSDRLQPLSPIPPPVLLSQPVPPPPVPLPPVPVSAHQMKPKRPRVQPGQPTRATIMANEARLHRLQANDRRSKMADDCFAFRQMGFKPNPIIEAEERERVKALRQQTMLGAALGLQHELWRFIDSANHSNVMRYVVGKAKHAPGATITAVRKLAPGMPATVVTVQK